MSLLKITNLSFAYGTKQVLENVSLSVANNEVVSIVGESGVGKTTLFNVIAGLLDPQQGTVELKGEVVNMKPGAISYMLQKDLLFEYKTIEANLILPMTLRGISKKNAIFELNKHLDAFGLREARTQYPHQLSGGMRQRAALLRTYLFGKEAMLLDEPFSALDPLTKGKMHEWYLKVMKSISTATLLITHDIDEAIFLSDKIYVLKGSPATLYGPIEVAHTESSLRAMSVSTEFLEVKKRVYEYLDK